jgi:hypothetical protein
MSRSGSPSRRSRTPWIPRRLLNLFLSDALGDPMIGDEVWGTKVAEVGRRLLTIVLVVVPVAMIAFFGYLAVGNGSSESALGHDLKSRGVHTTGTVTAIGDHDSFSYGFFVEGSHYSGNSADSGAGQTLHAGQLHVGQQIPVIYDAKDPQRSCSCDVNLLTKSAWSGELVPLSVVIIGTVAVEVTQLTRRRKRQTAAE